MGKKTSAWLGLAALLTVLGACGDLAAASTTDQAAGIDAAVDTLQIADGATTTDAAAGCQPNAAGCVDGQRFVCNAAGTEAVKTPCDTGTTCIAGKCVQCQADKDCPEGQVCNVEGMCKPDRLTITTTALASGLVGAAYKTDLTATGGVKPYTWSVKAGTLPGGLTLDPATGSLAGKPTAGMDGPITIEVTDAQKDTDSHEFALKIVDNGLIITTASPLKSGQDGATYSVTFAAQGGTPPYFWGVVPGTTLPAGLSLSSDGILSGTLNGDGKFGFDIKVFDSGEATLKATKHFDLTVTLAPLQIVGTQQVDLFIAKLITLPLIVVAQGLPVPYSAQLEATGGKKPYHWKEQPIPGVVKSLIKNSGIPTGLTLADNGGFSGAVTDPSLVVTVDLSFLKLPAVSGFIFSAQVTDSQATPASATGLFIIPTVPIGGP